MTLLLLAVNACLINNVVLSQFLGICSFLGVSKKPDTAAGMGMALTFVLTLSSLVCGILYHFLLVPFGLEYLKTIVFILIVAALVQFVEMFLKKFATVLGVALINVQKDYSILTGTVYGFATAIGYTIAIIILANIRDKMVNNDVPESFRGFPIVMITAALMSIAFFGFSALK